MKWIKSVRTYYGSVAVSSPLEAETINLQGVYCVGCPNGDTSTSTTMEQLTPEKVIQLRMPAGDNGHSKSYSLNDLKDLQSKLMLIAAKASKGKDEIDRFSDVSFCLLPGIH